MSFLKYLKENFRLVIFYIILMSFISTVICLDRRNRALTSNIFYIIFVSLFMFILYLITDYFIKSSQIKTLSELETSEDKTPVLPKPMDSKDEIYSSIINGLYSQYTSSVKELENNFIENKDFMTAWAHEIKTPITTSELIIERGMQSLSKDTLTSLNEELMKIDDYVEKVLYYSRSDSFSKDYVISEIVIVKLIKESIKKHSIIFIKKGIKVIVNVQDTIIIDSDKKWLLFIFDQLLSNALKYTDTKGTVTFNYSEDEKEGLLSVEDDGVGIKAEDLNRVFNKAYTGFNGRNENIKATGLGLYLSQKLARRLGHYLSIESEYGRGTKVYIHFPKWTDYYDVTKM